MSFSAPQISILIPTFNRCESLRETLQEMQALKLRPEIRLEIVVVNNNSTDQTAAVIEEMARRSKWPIRGFFEPKQGISFARNRLIRESGGEFIAFTDDDVLVTENWIQSIYDGFQKYDADCISGKITPLWEMEPPGWFRDPENLKLIASAFALLDHGPDPFIMKELKLDFFYGANMAFRKKIFDEVNGFREDLGLIGNTRFYGEDTEMISRFFEAGKRMVYIPDSVVFHKIPPERMNMKYVRKWRYDKALTAPPPGAGRKLPFWLFRECLVYGGKALAAYIAGNRHLGIKNELFFWTQAGQIAGMLNR